MLVLKTITKALDIVIWLLSDARHLLEPYTYDVALRQLKEIRSKIAAEYVKGINIR